MIKKEDIYHDTVEIVKNAVSSANNNWVINNFDKFAELVFETLSTIARQTTVSDTSQKSAKDEYLF